MRPNHAFNRTVPVNLVTLGGNPTAAVGVGHRTAEVAPNPLALNR